MVEGLAVLELRILKVRMNACKLHWDEMGMLHYDMVYMPGGAWNLLLCICTYQV